MKKILTVAGLMLSLMGATGVAKAYSSTADKLEWPEVKDSYLRVGEFADPRDIRRVITSLPKREVRLLLNHPNFSEGLLGVHEWDYVFNFLTGRGEEYVQCQYKVLFDKNMRVSSTHWREPACGGYIIEKPPVVNESHPLVLSSDGLFAFGRSGFDDLQATGRENLRNLAGQIKVGYKNLRSIDVAGFTDRIGSDESNYQLSAERANTVKQYLVSQGINPNVIRTRGEGETRPVVACPGEKSAAVIACLMPNRRIEINVNGDI